MRRLGVSSLGGQRRLSMQVSVEDDTEELAVFAEAEAEPKSPMTQMHFNFVARRVPWRRQVGRRAGCRRSSAMTANRYTRLHRDASRLEVADSIVRRLQNAYLRGRAAIN